MENKKVFVADEKSINGLKHTENTVLCFGHFNVIHPGHIRYLQYAKSLGKNLVIALIGDNELSKVKGKYYPQKDRGEGLALLPLVDQVFILESISLSYLCSALKPSVMVLGKDMEARLTDDLRKCINGIEADGGKVVFHAGEIHYASSELLHGDLHDLQTERRALFLQACARHNITMTNLQERLESFKNVKILVVGDTIVDQYVACDAIGMSAEAPVLVVKELESREFVGGAGVVASHIQALGAGCTFVSVVGKDENAKLVKNALEKQGVEIDLIEDDSRPTTFKIRYMVENQKLFRVSRLKEHPLSKILEDTLIKKIHDLAKNADGILISDFVYGVITKRVLDEIIIIARRYNLKLFGDLQCSSQVGNVSKFEKFELICPTEREARVALSNQQDGVEFIANTLIEKTGAKKLVMKLGADGFISYEKDQDDQYIQREHFPALETNPVDVAGAGDSLLAALSVSICSGGTLMESSAIGACMAALAVQTVGNIPVTDVKLKNFVKSLERTA